MPSNASIYDKLAIDRLRQKLRIDPDRIRRLRTTFLKKFHGAEAALATLPEKVREAFSDGVEFHPLDLEKRCDSEMDGASKLIFRTHAGMLIESVLLRAGTGRVSLCISCQIGCAAACDFCATGRMGIARNLTTAEILDQIVQANEQLEPEGRKVRNLVFMGMGEPFHNEKALYETLTALTDPTQFHHSPGRILISSVGIQDGMLRCAERFPRVNLALSLHSVRQSTRESIIPLAAKYPLYELQATLRQLNAIQGKPVMIEYLMLQGINDSLEEAAQLADWLEGLDVHVNLIPYNQVDEAPHLTGTEKRPRQAFAQVLKSAGLATTIRYSMGQDIEAACGQLVRRENLAVAMGTHDK